MWQEHFDVICDQLVNRRMVTWNLFVLYNKKTVNDVIYESVLQLIIRTNQNARIIQHIKYY
jgi:hypothetical protein